MVVLKYYETPFEAEVARGRLESEGIAAIVQNDNLANVLPLGNAIQSFRPRVVVNDEDAALAAEILGIVIENPHAGDVCPECGSQDIAFKTSYHDEGMSLRSFVRFIMTPLFLFGVAHSGNLRRESICRKCGHRSKTTRR